ncbi:GNAT family N-acetyltransferase [Exiguobacterium sp. LL15]|uniref:GNAT family N-acetyltransferase n=1 Tax=Exiguobacterium sp. LL15 TaxID=2950547 RepID=UPI00210A3707|nr:GNAT family protein [Exiguobacterium sp. LL15]MCQ4090364.1 GNAT family N-acetyltransferase [Exiguobacterium sp. LL15]
MFRLQVSDHVSLQLFERHHAEGLFALVDANRAHLREWLGWVDGTTETSTYQESVIPAWLQQFADGNGFTCGIYLEDELVGTIGLHEINQHLGQTSLGYYLGEKDLRKGVMTDVVRFVTNYCFETLGLNRVVIECATGNVRSRRIPERLGFTEEGILRDAEKLYGTYHDIQVYAMLRRDWTKTQEVAACASSQ